MAPLNAGSACWKQTTLTPLIPAGHPPPGGWPVIAWAHGTSGVARMCAPSLEKDLEYGEEGLMPMVRAAVSPN